MAKKQLSIRPMPVGAEVIELADGTEQDPAVQAQLYEAWLTHGILLFRGIDSIERHLTLSRCFGELEIHPIKAVQSDLNPLLIEIGGKKRLPAMVFDETEIRANRIAWHRDTAYTPDICKGAMLRMVEPPPRLGETRLADTAKAYDDLPAEVKARLDGLEYKASYRANHELDGVDRILPGTFWKTVRPATREEDPDARIDEKRDNNEASRYPPVVHPAVLTHPESGRKCIFLSPTYVEHFLGMEAKESRELLEYLVAHMLQPKYVYEHHWSVNDAIVWDNRRFMHASGGNLPDDSRWGLRTTLAGSTRTGRYFDSDAKVSNMPIMAD